MIGRADIEESKSNVAMNAWLPQASYKETAKPTNGSRAQDGQTTPQAAKKVLF